VCCSDRLTVRQFVHPIRRCYCQSMTLQASPFFGGRIL
jgi:hypothetical protein